MLEVLYRWNRWGSNLLDSGIKREMTEKILRYVNTKEVVVLIGARRSGKSTILYQIMDALEQEKVPREAMLHINFEEPQLIPFLTLKGLDEIYDQYREHLFPKGKAYLFFDEIQNIPEWERWVRARSQTEEIKIFITGSSARLMSREIATLLTGRHLSFEITPLSFGEYLRFKEEVIPKTRLPVAAPSNMRHALNEFQKWGGFPAVVLAREKEHKQSILTEYFDDILYKDIVLRYGVRDPMLLRHLAVHLLTQTGNLLSFQRISTLFQVSSDLGTAYCRHLQESFMVELLPIFSPKASIRQRHPHKIYATDLGLRHVVGLAHSVDEGRLAETLVYHALRRRYGDNVFYWKGKNEIDFLIREGNAITQIWQVAEKLDDAKVLQRELKAIEEARDAFPKAEAFLVTKAFPDKSTSMPCKILFLWMFLLQPTFR
jgi:predicted AAA+ superfamily ATPase